jgi:mono/diheme cytochrome c family protein
MRQVGIALFASLSACSGSSPAPTPEPASPTAQAESAPPASPPATPVSDPYHPRPRDTVDVALYKAWQQYSLQCARCHGEDGLGTSFGPNLIEAMKPGGDVPTREDFFSILHQGREDKGMPPASKVGVDSMYFEGLYQYLKGRSEGRYHGGRPARREG